MTGFLHPERRPQLQARAAADGPIAALLVNEALFYEAASDLAAQQVRCWLDYEVLSPAGKFDHHQAAVTLIRNAEGRTVMVEGQTRCASCNAPVDLVAQRVCPDCGTDLRRDALGWRLYDIEPATGRPDRSFTPRADLSKSGTFVGLAAATLALYPEG